MNFQVIDNNGNPIYSIAMEMNDSVSMDFRYPIIDRGEHLDSISISTTGSNGKGTGLGKVNAPNDKLLSISRRVLSIDALYKNFGKAGIKVEGCNCGGRTKLVCKVCEKAAEKLYDILAKIANGKSVGGVEG